MRCGAATHAKRAAMTEIAQVTTFVLAGMAVGWIALFSFVFSPVSYTTFDGGRAERIVKAVMNRGHGLLGLLAFFAAIAALLGFHAAAPAQTPSAWTSTP